MKRLLLAAAIFLGLASPLLADQPLVIYGQTLIPFNARSDNPPATLAGVVGEASLPYTVPDGYILEINSFGIEAYAITGNVGMFLWIGPPPVANAKALHTVMANDHYEESVGLRYQLMPGKILNASMMNTENPAQLVGWHITGRLIPLPSPLPPVEPPPTDPPCNC